jgi:hypothetical protein
MGNSGCGYESADEQIKEPQSLARFPFHRAAAFGALHWHLVSLSL